MSNYDNSEALPAAAARDVLDKYGMDEVIIIARKYSDDGTFHHATWGTTARATGQAAIAGESISKMIAAQPSDYGRAANILGAEIKAAMIVKEPK